MESSRLGSFLVMGLAIKGKFSLDLLCVFHPCIGEQIQGLGTSLHGGQAGFLNPDDQCRNSSTAVLFSLKSAGAADTKALPGSFLEESGFRLSLLQ